MSAKFVESLPDLPLAELCARLRGKYADKTYGRHPLYEEAARRLEALGAEVERLRAAIKGAEIAITRDEGSDAAARILIEAQREAPK